jgi:hypothetical protein
MCITESDVGIDSVEYILAVDENAASSSELFAAEDIVVWYARHGLNYTSKKSKRLLLASLKRHLWKQEKDIYGEGAPEAEMHAAEQLGYTELRWVPGRRVLSGSLRPATEHD